MKTWQTWNPIFVRDSPCSSGAEWNCDSRVSLRDQKAAKTGYRDGFLDIIFPAAVLFISPEGLLLPVSSLRGAIFHCIFKFVTAVAPPERVILSTCWEVSYFLRQNCQILIRHLRLSRRPYLASKHPRVKMADGNIIVMIQRLGILWGVLSCIVEGGGILYFLGLSS